MKSIHYIILIITITASFSVLNIETKNDVRKTHWGMSPKEVEDSEYPRVAHYSTSPNTENIEIWYKNITFDLSTRKADIGYFFNSSNELEQVNYIIYKASWDNTNTYPLSFRVDCVKAFIEAFNTKGYTMDTVGWSTIYGKSKELDDCIGYKKCSLNQLDLDEIYQCAIKHNRLANTLKLKYLSQRTTANLDFPIKLNEPAYSKIVGWVQFFSNEMANQSPF